MATVVSDIIEGKASFTFDGWVIERVFIVTGLTGEPYDKIIDALNTTGIPALGDAHPSSSLEYCYLREAIPTIEGKANDIVRIRLIYANATWPTERQQVNTLEVGGALSQIQTNKDRFGNTITVGYTYPADYAYDDALRGTFVETSGLVTKLVPERHIVKRRIEYSDPSLKADLYLGAVNSGPWSLDIGAATGTWLCTQLEGVSNDGGLTWVVTYAFQYRKDTWETTVTFIDPNTGRPPADLYTAAQAAADPDRSDVGIKDYEHYDIRNFNQLGL